MIIAEFAKYLQQHDDEIIEHKSSCSLLCAWVLSILERKPKNHVEKIVHAEIALAENEYGEFLLALYNFALSYEQHLMRKWLHDKNANDFNN